MKRIVCLTLSLLGIAPCFAQWKYSETKTVDAEDTYFGKTYKDPYRWLENLKEKHAKAWFNAQTVLTAGPLAKTPGRDELVNEWMELDNLKPASYSAINY